MKASEEFHRNKQFISHIISNRSSYQLTEEERLALCYGLEQCILLKLNGKAQAMNMKRASPLKFYSDRIIQHFAKGTFHDYFFKKINTELEMSGQ